MLNGDHREISVFPFQTTGITQINSLCWNVLLPHKSLSRRTRCQIIGCADWGRCWPEAIEQVRTASSIKTSSLNRQPVVWVGTPLYFETLCGLHTVGSLHVYSPSKTTISEYMSAQSSLNPPCETLFLKSMDLHEWSQTNHRMFKTNTHNVLHSCDVQVSKHTRHVAVWWQKK